MSLETEELKILTIKCGIFCKKTILKFLEYKSNTKKRNDFISFQFKTLFSNNFV